MIEGEAAADMSDEFRRKRKLITYGTVNRLYGWGTWIRTKIDGVRVPAASSCLTTHPSAVAA